MKLRSVNLHIPLMAALLLLPLTVVSAGSQPVEAIQAERETPDELRLDIGVQVFGPGLPMNKEGKVLPDVEIEAMGIFPHLRRSEGRYIAFHLRSALNETGHWGAVRVIPVGLDSIDVTISGEIVKSTGKELVLQVAAHDSSGRKWFRKKFKQQADPYAYNDENPEDFDPYLSLYNRIANELLAARSGLKDEKVLEIRQLGEIRFAADLAPDAFADYLATSKKGRYRMTKLPADGDTMIDRVNLIRERDYMFIDTLNGYYEDFFLRMDQPYDDWRAYSYQEQVVLQKMRRRSIWSQILGGALIVGGAAADVDSSAGRTARDAAVIGGAVAIQHGIAKRQESKMHVEALRELAMSFDAEVEPMLVEVEGQTLQLTGSVEAQYADWRRLLRTIFATETGLPVDLNDGSAAVAGSAEN